MKFNCDLETLSKAVSDVSLAISSKSTIPALEGVLLECSDQKLLLTGYDLEIGITTTIPIFEEEPGSIVLNAQLLGEILKKMDAQTVFFETDEKMMTTIVGDNTRFHILGMEKEEYPALPEMEKENVFSIKDTSLKKMIYQTLFCTSPNSNTPVLQGSLFEIKQNLLTVVSVDGYRVALCREEIDFAKNLSFIVSAKALAELSKLLQDQSEDETHIYVGKKHVTFHIGSCSMIARLIEGEFLNYTTAISSEHKTRIKADVKNFIQLIERVSIIINQKNKTPVKMEVSNNKMYLTCESTIGRVQDEQEIMLDGETLTIAFNNRYMLDALRHCEKEEVFIDFNGSLSPIQIVPIEDDSFLYLVLPVRMRGSDA